MSFDNQKFQQRLIDFFDPARRLPPMDSGPALERLLRSHQDNVEGVFDRVQQLPHPTMRRPQWRWIAVGAAVFVLTATLAIAMWRSATPAPIPSIPKGGSIGSPPKAAPTRQVESSVTTTSQERPVSGPDWIRPADGSENLRPGETGCLPEDFLQRKRTLTLFQLLADTYPIQDAPSFPKCQMVAKSGLIFGGPEWMKSSLWKVDGDPGTALLAERFKLKIRRETRQLPVYFLKVGRNGPKLLSPGNSTSAGPEGQFILAPNASGAVGFLPSIRGLRGMWAKNASMQLLANTLFSGPGSLGRMVLDRTELDGKYDFQINDEVPIDLKGGIEVLDQGYRTAKLNLLEAIGLELEESQEPFEVWIVEHAEKPKGN